ncbi:hypothetical protein LTR94_024789, partial [Friedmanniomyces endolithicus]
MEDLERTPLFTALTRPQMFAGVTYNYFVINAVIAAELFLVFRSIWVLPIALLIHGVGVLLCLLPAGAQSQHLAMQLLPSLSQGRRTVEREKAAGVHLPYARHLNDHTIETRDGLLLQIIRLRGLLFETADTAELNYRKTLRDAMLRAVGTSRFALYHHIERRRVEVDSEDAFPDAFSQSLGDRWADRLSNKKLFANDLYLTLIRRPLQGRLGLADQLRNLITKSGEPSNAALAYELGQLDAGREALLAALGDYAPQLLSVYETPNGPCSEPLEFLSSLYNGERRPVLLPTQDLGAYLPYRRVSFGQNAVELSSAGRLDRQFVAMISVKDYPASTTPGMFDELLRLPHELTITQSFAFVERQAALDRMNLALRRMRSAEDEALSLRDELVQAKDDVAAGRAGYGEHHMTIALRADTLASLDAGVAEVTAALGDMGVVATREDIALEPAFWAQFPANFNYIARRGLVSTSNFAGLASAHNFPLGSARNNHWGQAISLLETTAAGPYFFNFHQGDLGNFTIIGPSGSGKTVVLNFLLAQARRLSPRIIFFDKDRGAELFIRAIGGRYDLLRPGEASGLNPLQLPDTAANRSFIVDWLTTLAGEVDLEDLERIREAVSANFDQPIGHRRLRHLVELFRGDRRPHAGDLWSRLRPWWGDGDRAWLFDNPVDQTDLTVETVGFDMTVLLDEPVLRTPAMMYLFHRVEERLDGTPAIIVVDEGWKALDDEVFVRRIKDWEKTIRKRNGIVGFATQSAQDALESRIASAIVEQAATQIFMVNPKARAQDYIEGFGLTQHEFDL